MNNNSNQPRDYDAVLGGQAPPPVQGAVLGGIEGVKRRLASPMIEARIAALSEALKYGDAGLELAIAALKDPEKQVQRSAYLLLREREEPQVKQALREYKSWNLVERLHIDGYPRHATTFAKRKVEEFDPEIGITDLVDTAYAVRGFDEWNQNIYFSTQFERLLQDPQVNQLEALVIGLWDGDIVDTLVAAKDRLTNLKAIFIGDIISSECEISWIRQSDISPVLEAYPNLEVLQVRGGDGLAFSPVRHDNLEALIVETGGLSRETIAQICSLDLPALNHLELWLGSDNYGGDSSIADLKPILDDLVFPHLDYLGLRNSEYSNEIAEAVVNSLLIDRVKVLDLSMGTLTEKGALALLDCPAVHQLDILNVSRNYLSEYAIIELSSQLDEQVMVGHPADGYWDGDEGDRYCAVAE